MIDSREEIETPEGVELSLAPAGLIVRVLAWLIDLALRVAVYVAAGFVLGFLGALGAGAILLVVFALEWMYPVFFEVRSGATPGKASFGLCVVHADGSPVAFGSSLLRNLLRVADFLPFGYLVGIASVVLTRRFQRLGDLAAGTVVIHTRTGAFEPSWKPSVSPVPLPVALTVDEQQAIVAFSERSEAWGSARAREVAALSDAWTNGSDVERVAQLHGMAAWIAGAR